MTTKLQDRAMLVKLHVGVYSGTAHDKAVTESVNESYKADRTQAGQYRKRLVASHFMRGVTNARDKAFGVHRLLTLPWEDDGTRILSTKGYMDYTSHMKEARLKFEDEVKLFVKGLPEYIEEAKVRLGDMFNAEDYPDAKDLRDKFSFDVEVESIPNAADFRAKLSDDQVKNIVTDIERRCNKRIEIAINDIFERASALVKHMVERLKAYQPAGEEGKARNIIRDTVVYNIHEFAQLMTSLNVTGDPRIDELRKELLDQLVEPASPEILRTDDKARQQAIKNAQAILKKVKGYMS